MQYLPYKSPLIHDVSSVTYSIDKPETILTNRFSKQFEIHVLHFCFIACSYHRQIGSKDFKYVDILLCGKIAGH